MDIDNKLSILEGKSTIISLGSKAIFIKIGIAVVSGILLSYIIKPVYTLDLKWDKKEGKISQTLNYKNFSICSVILIVCVFLGINQLSYFN